MAVKIEVDPGDVDLSAAGLRRVDAHFERYVDDGRLPGWQLLVSRRGQVAHLTSYGRRDVEADRPVEDDTIFRVYSMTKPITSVAAMLLYEEGAFELTDPIGRFLPAYADMRVYAGGPAAKPVTVPATRPIQVRDLLRHTSGLTYGFHHVHPVDEMLRSRGFEWGSPAGMSLAEATDLWATLPLLFEPGTEWNYSYSTDVLGRLVEVLSGQPLDAFFAERIFRPLGMTDTGFSVPAADRDRLAALYARNPQTGAAMRYDVLGDAVLQEVHLLSGGGGLVSTTEDYHRFTQMLRGRGALGGAQLLGPRTVDFMTRNHLPGGADLEAFGRPLFAETRFDGVGFGLGFSVVVDPAAYGVPSSVGEYAWGGAASTAFFVDPVEDLTAVFLTQLLPSSTYPIRTQLRQLLYAALTD